MKLAMEINNGMVEGVTYSSMDEVVREMGVEGTCSSMKEVTSLEGEVICSSRVVVVT